METGRKDLASSPSPLTAPESDPAETPPRAPPHLRDADGEADAEAAVHLPECAPPPTIGRPHPGRTSILRMPSSTTVPSVAADAGYVDRMWVGAASAIGAAHAYAPAGVRQDRYAFAAADGYVIAAVADGVSACPASGLGAQVASQIICDALAQAGGDRLRALLRDAEADLESVKGELLDCVSSADAAVRRLGSSEVDSCAYSTTLLFVIAAVTDDALAMLATQVGDSSAYVADPNGIRPVFAELRRGPLTVALPLSPEAMQRIRFAYERADLGSALLLATDGVAKDLESSRAVRDWVGNIMKQRQPSALEMHRAISYLRQGSADDRTLLTVTASHDL